MSNQRGRVSSDECQGMKAFALYTRPWILGLCRSSLFGFRISDTRWVLGKASFLAIATILLVAPTFAADAPSGVTNIFRPLSTPAQAIHEVSLLALAICAGIFLVVGGLLAYT